MCKFVHNCRWEIAISLTSGCWWSDSTSDSKKDGEGDARPGQTPVNILPCLYFGWVRPSLLSRIWVINGDYMGLHVIRRIDNFYFLCVWCLHLLTLIIFIDMCRHLAMSILYFGGVQPTSFYRCWWMEVLANHAARTDHNPDDANGEQCQSSTGLIWTVI